MAFSNLIGRLILKDFGTTSSCVEYLFKKIIWLFDIAVFIIINILYIFILCFIFFFVKFLDVKVAY